MTGFRRRRLPEHRSSTLGARRYGSSSPRVLQARHRYLTGAVLGVAALVLAAGGCSSSGGGGSSSNEPVKLTWWHNANNNPGRDFWKKVADEYHAAHPNVTIDVVPIQNEQLRSKIAVALQGQNPPDLFQQWGGGEMADQANAGKLMDLTDKVKTELANIGTAASGWQANGKQYGLPYTLGIVGFWYNKDLFAKAGITSPPATWDELLADAQKLKAAGIAPISLGGRDRWPDAFYWDYLAVRMCSQQVMQQSATDFNFSDPCWAQAGQKVQQLLGAQPFNKGFLATPAQQGATSSAGLLANGKAAMELQGHWNPSVMTSLTPNGKGLGDKLGWFPFPEVSGGAGTAGSALGGGDGFSCSVKAPPACVDFLKYLVSPEVQKRWAALNIGPPVAKGAEAGVSDPNLRMVIDARSKAPFVQLYLDIAYGSNVGQALNDAIAQQFAGSKSPQQVVSAIAEAAKNR
jgi:raffinose/stachyose/melibiose transport system substrate-binding protein